MNSGMAKKRPLIVSFSGVDGAGKSTQIEALRARLAKQGMRVSVIAFWDDVARLTWLRESAGHTLFKGDKGVGSPSKPIERRDKNVRSWPMSLVRLMLYFVDAMSARAVYRQALRSNSDAVILDRWVYDELANLTLQNGINRVYARLIARLAPQPDVSFLLDAEPVQARARKPEYPLDFLIENRASYARLANLVGHIEVIPPMPVAEVAQAVSEIVLKAMEARGHRGKVVSIAA
jgi:thymidylate kinase